MLTAKSLSQTQVLSAFAHLCKANVRPDERHVSVARLDPWVMVTHLADIIIAKTNLSICLKEWSWNRSYQPYQPSILWAPFSCQPANRSTLSVFYGLCQAGRYGLLFPLPYRLHEVP